MPSNHVFLQTEEEQNLLGRHILSNAVVNRNLGDGSTRGIIRMLRKIMERVIFHNK